jgi:hypothetical protein
MDVWLSDGPTNCQARSPAEVGAGSGDVDPMFRREPKLMMILLFGPIVVGFVLALVGPRLIRALEQRPTVEATSDAPH